MRGEIWKERNREKKRKLEIKRERREKNWKAYIHFRKAREGEQNCSRQVMQGRKFAIT